jgi:autotransporter translocation and assembly factor TamB
MVKLFRWIIGIAATFLFVVLAALAFLQMPATKEKVRDLIFALAEKEGLSLSIGAIEGDPPFKWVLHNVHIKTHEGDTLDIKTVRLRVAILPLLRREISLSYSHIDEMALHYLPQEPGSFKLKSLPWTVAFKALKIEKLEVYNKATKKRGLFSLQTKAQFKRKGKAFFVDGKLWGEELGIELWMRGNKKTQYIESTLQVDLTSKEALAPFFELPVGISLSFEALVQGPWKSWQALIFPKPDELFLKPLKGEMKLQVRSLALQELQGLDPSSVIETSFDLYPNRTFEIQSLSLKSDLLCLKGQGRPDNFSASFLVPHLSRLVPHLSGIVSGDLHFKGPSASLTLESSQLGVGAATYTQFSAYMSAEKEQMLWKGRFNIEGVHPQVPLEGQGEFDFIPGEILAIKNSTLKLPGTDIGADVQIALPSMTAQGGIALQSLDLSRLMPFLPGTQLKGVLGGKVDFQDRDLLFFATLKSFQWNQFLTDRCTLQGQVTDLLTSPKGKISIEGATSYLEQFFFDGFLLETFWEKEGWPFSLQAVGKWKEPFSLNCSGRWNQNDFQLDQASGKVLQKTFTLKKPFSVQYGPSALVISECHFGIADGYFAGALHLSPQLCKIYMKAEHFPIDLFALSTSRFTLTGGSSLDVVLEGTEENLQGRINLLLEGANVLQSGKKVPIKSKGFLQANINHNIVQIHSTLTASGNQFMEFSASLPLTYQLYPLQLGLHKTQKVAAELILEGHLEEMFDFINIGSHRLTGLLSTRLLLSKTLADPSLLGTLTIQNGSYENYFTGMMLQEIQADAEASHHQFHISKLRATDGDKGILTAQGDIQLQENLPFTFDAVLEKLKILQLDWLDVACSGPLKITGTRESALAQGELSVARADIHIPDEFPIDLPVLPVTFVNEPPHLHTQITGPEPSYPFYYDTILHAKEDIFLTGRGLNCELRGDLHLTGKNIAVAAQGSLELVKGKFAFGGKEFTLTQGELTFGDTTYLNLSGTASLPDLTITAMLRGPLTAPVLTFQSTPPLPTSSIVARILFNKDVAELTALQALQLADTIVTLSGGAGPNVLESIRKSLGIDRLNIASSGEGSSRLAVQIGKYLTEGVMITLSQSTEGSQVIVEVELKGGFILQAETQEDEQGKFSLKWNKNY